MTSSKPGAPAGIREARREMYRQQILTAAEYEFSRSGFDNTKVTAIAATADVSVATLYKSFTNKDDIWNALIALRMNELVGLVRASVDSIESPLERIMVGMRAQVEFFVQHPNFLRFNVRENWNWATATDAGRGGQRGAWRAGVAMMTYAAEAALQAGELAHIRAEIASALMISALQVYLTDWVNSGAERSSVEVADELIGSLHRLLDTPVSQQRKVRHGSASKNI